ncbi:copper resistance protein NlpE [Carboxylicivirga taeanensis]|uniref:copper resistance protein NlpE n=1 Tax=Carboxylicivirga taeanensis TaxID=1416875 RepID=UPI003F6DC9D5
MTSIKNLPGHTALFILLLTLSACNFNKSEQKQQNHQNEFADMHNAKIALDWAGHYAGILPCASCPGIKINIQLKENGTYQKTTEYIDEDGEPETTTGTFYWSDDNNKITIEEHLYFVGEGQLIHLDKEGNRISGELASHYILKKKAPIN